MIELWNRSKERKEIGVNERGKEEKEYRAAGGKDGKTEGI